MWLCGFFPFNLRMISKILSSKLLRVNRARAKTEKNCRTYTQIFALKPLDDIWRRKSLSNYYYIWIEFKTRAKTATWTWCFPILGLFLLITIHIGSNLSFICNLFGVLDFFCWGNRKFQLNLVFSQMKYVITGKKYIIDWMF